MKKSLLIQNSTRLTCGKIKTFLTSDLAKRLNLICYLLYLGRLRYRSDFRLFMGQPMLAEVAFLTIAMPMKVKA